MGWIGNVIKKLLLVKEIRSKQGELHFQRYRLFSSPWLRLYIHKICKSDEDAHTHDHPWNFLSLILRGGYYEEWAEEPRWNITKAAYRSRGTVVRHKRSDSHKLRLSRPVWTMVLAYGRRQDWGYRVWSEDTRSNSKWVESTVYRKLKNGIFGEETL